MLASIPWINIYTMALHFPIHYNISTLYKIHRETLYKIHKETLYKIHKNVSNVSIPNPA